MTSKLKLFSDDEFNKSQGITQSEYARLRRVSRQIISRQVQLGIITLLPNGNIDPAKADKQLEDNLNPAFAQTQDNKKAPTAFSRKQAVGDKSKTTFAKAKTIEKGYQAKLAELAYKEKVGDLVNANDVKIAAFDIARKVRDNMLNIPDRIIAQLISTFGINVSSENTSKGRGIMTKEIEKALQGI